MLHIACINIVSSWLVYSVLCRELYPKKGSLAPFSSEINHDNDTAVSQTFSLFRFMRRLGFRRWRLTWIF